MKTLVKSFESADQLDIRHSAGGKLRQPYGELSVFARGESYVNAILDRLYADAALAQPALNKIGAFLADKLDAHYTARPTPKDRGRVIEKAVRYDNDFSFITDLASGQLELPLNRIKDAMDYLCGDNADARQLRAELKTLGVALVDETENNFSFPNKSDLRNLNTKLALEITRIDGSKSYHACELQCIHEDAKPFYNASHKHFEVMRKAKAEMQRSGARLARINNDLEKNGGNFRVCEKLAKDRVHHDLSYREAEQVYRSGQALRAECNRLAVTDGLNALLGYQPRNDSMADKVAAAPANNIYSRKLALNA